MVSTSLTVLTSRFCARILTPAANLANLTANFTNMNALQTNATVQLQTQINGAVQNIATNSLNITRLQGRISTAMQDISNLIIAVNGSQNSILTLQQDLNDVIDVVNAVANCTGGTCVPRVMNCSTSALPPPSNGDVYILGDHGGYAPVGTVAEFSCRDGFYMSGTVQRSTCQASGQWSAMASASMCMACTAGCGRCTGPTASGGCLSCTAGNVLGFALGGLLLLMVAFLSHEGLFRGLVLLCFFAQRGRFAVDSILTAQLFV